MIIFVFMHFVFDSNESHAFHIFPVIGGWGNEVSVQNQFCYSNSLASERDTLLVNNVIRLCIVCVCVCVNVVVYL